MRITRWAEYGVHIMAFIAAEQDRGVTAVGASRIADAQGIARDYTLQILHRLKEGGILESSRGPLGGFHLHRPAEQISLKDILNAAEGETFEIICESKPLTEERCAPDSSCGLRGIWYDLRSHLNEFLQNKSLREIVETLHGTPALVQLGHLHNAERFAESNGRVIPSEVPQG